ncbi:hypothetical protein OR1_02473 [Geobacter sp. OR-1]|uniref:carboxypeptidase regulatory-like domain-containing protein n=1 Tax=Geobacter sp. OR-1 TaxID=1266765 RepID=UPI000544395C|nr:carboxypeptidase regulatory-like domain-containing protein [Geobacter sp. OR-1]GAM10185.1 hypothetical protein OR1_02473 [Geobacter sp. OR-1]
MSEWEITRHQVAIAGKVTDSTTGRPLPGARISVSGLWDTLELNAALDGHFHVLDLENGTYHVEASMPGSGYGTGIKQVTITRNSEGKIQMAVAELQLACVH